MKILQVIYYIRSQPLEICVQTLMGSRRSIALYFDVLPTPSDQSQILNVSIKTLCSKTMDIIYQHSKGRKLRNSERFKSSENNPEIMAFKDF